MKKTILFLLAVIITASCLARPNANHEIQTSKMDLRLRSAYDKAISENNFDVKFECFVKLSEDVDEKKISQLKKVGFETRTYTKTILTGTFKASDTANITSVDFVKYIELAVPMTTK